MQVSEMMHEYPICCTELDTAYRAAELMKEQHIGALPVVEKKGEGRLIGIVTDRDLCMRVVAEGRNPANTLVLECMTSSPVCCRPEDDAEYALALMKENHIRRIPVVDVNHRICGMVSFANLVGNHVDHDHIFEMLKAVSVPTPEALLAKAHLT
jgi:CBS domain-containing protein